MDPILITGFEPFAGLPYNPSQALLGHLPDVLCGRPVLRAVLPVDTRQLPRELDRLYAQRPALVLHTGLAQSRAVLTIERRAVNQLDFDQADNAGLLIRAVPVIADAAAALQVRLPVDAILAALLDAGIPAESSDSAGTFLCNQALFYGLVRLPQAIPMGFIHLAPDEQLGAQLGLAGQPLQEQARAVRLAVELTLTAADPT